MVHFAGATDSLVGITHECDYPPGVENLPHLTASRIDSEASSRDIDEAVGKLSDEGSIYALDTALLEGLSPDLIITQGLCEVCAVSIGVVERAVSGMKSDPEILSLDPTSLEDVLEDAVRVGEAVGKGDETRTKVAALRERITRVEEVVSGLSRPRVGCIEWLDPPFSAGHWVPEMVRLAGGEDVFSAPGEASREMEWTEVSEAAPEILVLMPCGFDARRTMREARAFVSRLDPEVPAVKTGHVRAVDANSYFSRPAPRLVDGVEILARILHPGAFPDAQRFAPELAGEVSSHGSQRS